MNNTDYTAFMESDYILDNFVRAILEYKTDALNYGNSGLNYGSGRELKQKYHYIADEWLENYFSNFSPMDYGEFKRLTKGYKKRG